MAKAKKKLKANKALTGKKPKQSMKKKMNPAMKATFGLK